MSETKRFPASYYPTTSANGVPLAGPENATMVLAADYDRDLADMARQRDEALALLRWALRFVTNAADEMFQSYQNRDTGAIDDPEVAAELAEAQAWIDKARFATDQPISTPITIPAQ